MTEIPLYNRQTRQIEPEVIYQQAVMEFFFGTRPGLLLSELLLKHRWVTELYARQMRSPKSRARISEFIERYQIKVDELERPVDSFKCFNDFFIRKLKPEARPIDREPSHLIAPADSRLIVSELRRETILPVKGRSFTLRELLRDGIADQFTDGLCLIFRLAPVDYHRYCYVDDCTQSPVTVINGYYRSVNPLALWKMLPVFTENQREFCVLHTKNFGEVIHLDVGATNVGRIVQHHREGGSFSRGEEKGYFEFGGSTSILLLKAGVAQIDADIAEHSAKGIETIVRYGVRIGQQC